MRKIQPEKRSISEFWFCFCFRIEWSEMGEREIHSERVRVKWGSRVTPKKSKPRQTLLSTKKKTQNDSPLHGLKNWAINYLLIVSHFRAIFMPTNVTRQRRRPRQRQRRRLRRRQRRLRRRIASGDVTVCIHSLFSAIREINALCVDPTKQFAV